MADEVTEPILREWLDEYEGIYADFMQSLEDAGVEFGDRFMHAEENAALKKRLRDKGALFRNGDASISINGISTACVACTGCAGSQTFYFSLRCHRNCYFCFNPNQLDYREHLEHDRDWRGEFRELAREGRAMTHIALTGGEPLLRAHETLAFFEEAHALWPSAHLRLYTAGDLLDEQVLEDMIARGLCEIRFSIKLEDDKTVQEGVLDRIRMACEHDVDVMVEMPVMPGTTDEMKQLLEELDAIGITGINLLEFCFPFTDWTEFARRGFKVKNPPFPILYNYEYAGSLPIEGSEEACLELLDFALDREFAMGVHYCSLENKHRDQICQQNHAVPFDDLCYELDQNDFFWKTVKTFGASAQAARIVLSEKAADGEGRSWRYDTEDECLIVHPDLSALLAGVPVDLAESANVLEWRDEGVILRELALTPITARAEG
ncbi:radical SAM protein [Raoultibacter phocaeensis]|uniref:radical SAM protein n=1 Tax=Raoultibacter phocaeensis TaxID=2479841 RepID=UPI001118EB0A|nr:radical SAM protein [Raoultibacter phocaeensis]